jgi:hypothetical protein
MLAACFQWGYNQARDRNVDCPVPPHDAIKFHTALDLEFPDTVHALGDELRTVLNLYQNMALAKSEADFLERKLAKGP